MPGLNVHVVLQICERVWSIILFGSNLPHIASVGSMARCGGRIGNDNILKFILGDGANGE